PLRRHRIRPDGDLCRRGPRGRHGALPTAGRVVPTQGSDTDVPIRLWGEKIVIVVPQDRAERFKALAHQAVREPFLTRTWSEFFFVALGTPLAFSALGFIVLTMFGGVVLAVTFFGTAVLALSIRGARGFATLQRGLARGMLGEHIEEPDAFAPRPGFLGWLQAALRDRAGWRAIAYFLIKVPFSVFVVYAALSVWWDAFVCLIHPLFGRGAGRPPEFGLVRNVFDPGYLHLGDSGFFSYIGIFMTGVILLLAAPWVVRGAVYIDRFLMQTFLGTDSIAARMRTLE